MGRNPEIMFGTESDQYMALLEKKNDQIDNMRAENQKLKERIEYLEGQIKVNREIAMDNCAWGKDSCG
jgi:hypothetical protein